MTCQTAVPTLLVTVDHVSLSLPGDSRQEMVLHDIDWRIRRGDHCALTGGNGAGKSTLLRLLRGELRPARGSICWHTAEGAETSPLAGRAMSALVSPALQGKYQREGWDITGRDLLLTAFDDTPLLYSRPPDVRRHAAEAMAARLKAEHLLACSISVFSQGQLRLLLCARALLREPPLLLLDECVDGLDAAHRARLFGLLEEYTDRCTVVMTAHRQGLIPTWCSGRRHVRQGRMLAVDTPQGILLRERPPRCKEARVQSVESETVLFCLEKVSVFVDRRKVLHDIDWSMHEGEHWHLTGANGSGKSTLLRLLAGDEFVAVGGRVCRRLPRRGGFVQMLEDVRRGVRLVSDLSSALYGYALTGLELVCSGFDNSVGLYRRYADAELREAREAMERLDVAPLAEHSIRRLSSGQLRRLFLARALVGEPDILLLDEPCSGLDEESRFRYLDTLDNLSAQGLSLVFVSHYDEDTPLCINRQARMEGGRLVVTC
ncbi:MAG: ATP-binding cassette domain-containing protein [Desulfovibrio sp.]|jgi:molybdate transport system ATP-binding protein|nr:ATP-binding cassette domain-containing protein [Desulfovibrio sp.]